MVALKTFYEIQFILMGTRVLIFTATLEFSAGKIILFEKNCKNKLQKFKILCKNYILAPYDF